jgi:hypothetical protein
MPESTRSTDALEAVAVLLGVSEDAIPESGVAIVSYVNPEGKELVAYGFLGDSTNVFSTIGTLEVIKGYLTEYALE